ncbi:MAG TPA: tRNA epoxyqueuosine(34) reductase QueG [Anaerolineales bacterium]|nr:tRNA epoxyqueuosine(34) reductase QueG [Anaerolineales bacterium]
MNQVKTLRQAIDGEARRLGFHLIGVTTPDPPPHFPTFLSWVDAGYHGQMEYLNHERSRQRRADPGLILPECRSILVLGMPYWTSHPQIDFSGEDKGRVSAYAWGDDYHDVFKQRLQVLVSFIEGQVGHVVQHRWYTDTGPLLERDLAQRAGLGWIGKNTCLINPHQGSFFLLAEILMDLELEPDLPFESDHCGNCTRCLDACPTGCILPERVIDSRRCISYLTIELKGEIPPDLRSLMGDWVFGCDICQQVCPWNLRFSPLTGDSAFIPRTAIPAPNLRHELGLSQDEFSRKFKESPIKRARRRGYLRNIAVALGNRRDPDALDDLLAALVGDPEPLVRGHCAWALGDIGGQKAHTALEQTLEKETDPHVLQEIRWALIACKKED